MLDKLVVAPLMHPLTVVMFGMHALWHSALRLLCTHNVMLWCAIHRSLVSIAIYMHKHGIRRNYKLQVK